MKVFMSAEENEAGVEVTEDDTHAVISARDGLGRVVETAHLTPDEAKAALEGLLRWLTAKNKGIK